MKGKECDCIVVGPRFGKRGCPSALIQARMQHTQQDRRHRRRVPSIARPKYGAGMQTTEGDGTRVGLGLLSRCQVQRKERYEKTYEGMNDLETSMIYIRQTHINTMPRRELNVSSVAVSGAHVAPLCVAPHVSGRSLAHASSRAPRTTVGRQDPGECSSRACVARAHVGNETGRCL